MSKFTTVSSVLFKRSAKPWTPHAYQKRALKHLLANAAAALFLDPGLGKTSISLAAFSYLKKRGLANKALIIAPMRVCYQVWPSEVAQWKDFQHLKVVVLHGPKKNQLLEEDADIYMINPEGLEWLIGVQNRQRFDTRRWRNLGFDTLIIDELTKFKHSKGVRFKALKLVLSSFARRWGLTGTPAPNGLLDLFGQCYVLDLGRSLGQYVTHYRSNYFTNPDGMGWKWVPQHGAPERIYERLKPLALRMSAEEYLDLPPLIDLYDELELPTDARKMYDQLEDDLLAKVEENIIVAANAASASSKLRQLANGGLYVDDDVASVIAGKKRGSVVAHNVKTEWLLNLIDELQGQPLLVAYEFHHDLERLKAALGKETPHIGAGVSGKASKAVEDAWNADELPVLLVQQDAASHGLNLQKGTGSHLAHYSMTWNLETYDQLIRRIWRQGSRAKKVFRHHAIMVDTIDEDQRWALLRKDKGQKALFEALVARRRK